MARRLRPPLVHDFFVVLKRPRKAETNIMTATKHHALVALDERIRILRQAMRALESTQTTEDDERAIELEIERLKERLSMMRRHRETKAPTLAARQAELDGLERLRAACEADTRVADAFWMSLQVSRSSKSA